MIEAAEAQEPAQAARLFRDMLSAFSRPATPVSLSSLPEAPPPLLPAAAAVALSLFDYQTPVFLAPSLDTEALRKFIRFHTGVPLVARPEDAAFGMLSAGEAAGLISRFNAGSHEYPDRSATLVIQVAGFDAGTPVMAAGPGLAAPVSFRAEGITPALWRDIAENALRFPLGLDFLFADAARLAACPRSTRISLMENA